jgi:mannose/cellobiose epimerase-like protein (N-acyl-D-glucosamine 2-epimerase family)
MPRLRLCSDGQPRTARGSPSCTRERFSLSAIAVVGRTAEDNVEVTSSAPLQSASAGAGFRTWAIEKALPLWSTTGYDSAGGLFEEQLTLSGEPVRSAPRRVMVQARQLSVYSLADRRGWATSRDLALETGVTVIEQYWAADGEPGWVFSLNRDGSVHDGKRDLYAHAFALFALAGLLKLQPGEPRFVEAIDATTAVLDETFADPIHGGLWDCLPRPDDLRRQNPHMHLLEAWLELFEATGEPGYLARADSLVQLASDHFVDEGSGALREFYRDDWSVFPAAGEGSVEPGHQFEWAWLLRRYRTLGGTRDEVPVERLVESALRSGVDYSSGRILDEVGEDGIARERSSRSWPYCEAIKSLSVETTAGSGDHGELIDLLWRRLSTEYCRPELEGGWIDRLDAEDEPLSTVMPASTLYHLMVALSEWEQTNG